MVITEPTVPTEQQNTLSDIDFCSALWLPARLPEQRLVTTHIEPSGRLTELLPSPRPHYSARPTRFGSRGPSENVPVRLGYVTEVNWPRGETWENAVQARGKRNPKKKQAFRAKHE